LIKGLKERFLKYILSLLERLTQMLGGVEEEEGEEALFHYKDLFSGITGGSFFSYFSSSL